MLGKAQSQTIIQTKSNVFIQWQKYTQKKIEDRKMNAVSSFFFICKVLRKTIVALKMNAIQSKFKSAEVKKNAPHLLRGCFTAFKDNWKLKSRIKHFRADFAMRKASYALQVWYGVLRQSNQYSEIVEFF